MSTPYTPSSGTIVDSAQSSEIDLGSSDLSRVLPRQISTGNQRGTQNITGKITVTNPVTGEIDIAIDGTTGTINVGSGAIVIDGPNNAVTVTNDDNSKVEMGLIPDGSGDFGFFALDTSGYLLYKIVGSTQYWYDKTYGLNNIQMGLLPDGSYGLAIAKPGNSVASAFS